MVSFEPPQRRSGSSLSFLAARLSFRSGRSRFPRRRLPLSAFLSARISAARAIAISRADARGRRSVRYAMVERGEAGHLFRRRGFPFDRGGRRFPRRRLPPLRAHLRGTCHRWAGDGWSARASVGERRDGAPLAERRVRRDVVSWALAPEVGERRDGAKPSAGSAAWTSPRARRARGARSTAGTSRGGGVGGEAPALVLRFGFRGRPAFVPAFTHTADATIASPPSSSSSSIRPNSGSSGGRVRARRRRPVHPPPEPQRAPAPVARAAAGPPLRRGVAPHGLPAVARARARGPAGVPATRAAGCGALLYMSKARTPYPSSSRRTRSGRGDSRRRRRCRPPPRRRRARPRWPCPRRRASTQDVSARTRAPRACRHRPTSPPIRREPELARGVVHRRAVLRIQSPKRRTIGGGPFRASIRDAERERLHLGAGTSPMARSSTPSSRAERSPALGAVDSECSERMRVPRKIFFNTARAT